MAKIGYFSPKSSPQLQGVSADASPVSKFLLSHEPASAGLGADDLQQGTQPVFNWITFIQTEAGCLGYILERFWSYLWHLCHLCVEWIAIQINKVF
jgi:hypothetical protein